MQSLKGYLLSEDLYRPGGVWSATGEEIYPFPLWHGAHSPAQGLQAQGSEVQEGTKGCRFFFSPQHFRAPCLKPPLWGCRCQLWHNPGSLQHPIGLLIPGVNRQRDLICDYLEQWSLAKSDCPSLEARGSGNKSWSAQRMEGGRGAWQFLSLGKYTIIHYTYHTILKPLQMRFNFPPYTPLLDPFLQRFGKRCNACMHPMRAEMLATFENLSPQVSECLIKVRAKKVWGWSM